MTSESGGKVPVAEAASAGLQFLVAHWSRLLGAAAYAGGIYAAFIAGFGPGVAASGSTFGALIIQLGLSCATVVAIAPVFRLALRQESVGLAGIQVGADELRLLLAQLAVLAIVLFIVLVGSFALVLVAMSLAASSGVSLEALQNDPEALVQAMGPMGALLISLIGFAIIAALLWASVRFCLAQPAAIGDRRVMVMGAARWTKGNAWRILAAYLLLGAPLVILSMMLGAILKLTTGVDPSDVRTWATAAPSVLAGASFIYGALSFLIVSVPLAAMSAYLYKGLRPN